jgi:hypothetical protein
MGSVVDIASTDDERVQVLELMASGAGFRLHYRDDRTERAQSFAANGTKSGQAVALAVSDASETLAQPIRLAAFDPSRAFAALTVVGAGGGWDVKGRFVSLP